MAPELSAREFRAFYARGYGQVLSVLTVVTGSRSVAEDLVQEALARAWERRRSIEDLDRWVVTVALNLARNRWRRLAREVLRSGVEDGPAACAGPDRGALMDLHRALRDLPARQREVIALYYLVDLPVAEIAALLRLSEGGVKHALYRGRASLAAVLTPEETHP